MQNDIYVYYANSKPGLVTVLGPDCWNGTAGQLTAFKNSTGATYPLLLSGSSISTLYGIAYDNYLVVDQTGIIRYISPVGQPQGTRYDLAAIRATIDAYAPTAVGDPASDGGAPRLRFGPNPMRGAGVFVVTRGAPGVPASISITAADGRVVRRLAVSGARTQQVVWDGRDEHAQPSSNGVYHVVLAEGGVRTGESRIVVIR